MHLSVSDMVEEVYEEQGIVQIQAQVQPAPVHVAVPVEQVPIDDRLRGHIDQALTICVEEDLIDGRRHHEWADYALDNWHKVFLDRLVRAPDDAARVELIKSKASPELFHKLHVKLLDGAAPHNYAYFIEALHTLIQEHGNQNAAQFAVSALAAT